MNPEGDPEKPDDGLAEDLEDKRVLVVDSGGLFIEVARRLARDFGKVYYASEWLDSFPSLNRGIVGDGFSDIEHVAHPLEVAGEVDLVLFPDSTHAPLQEHFEAIGVRVWGARKAEALEQNRSFFLRTLRELDLKVPKHTICNGLSELNTVLKEKEDCYVKVSKWRGTFETAHWRSFDLDEALLDLWAMRFGPAKELITFIVCDAIDGAEVGADTYCIDGQWPSVGLTGFEAKDSSYLGAVTKREDMPQELTETMDAFSDYLKRERYRQFWSMEMRDGCFIDATVRAGLPSSASQMELWDNFSEIVWHGANGELVEPEPLALFSAECVLTMKHDKESWGVIEVPDNLRQWMKLAGCCEIDGRICFPAETGGISGDLVGWLVAIGNSPREAIDQLKEYVEQLPDGVTARVDALVDVLREIELAADEGIEFTDKPLPKPEKVMT